MLANWNLMLPRLLLYVQPPAPSQPMVIAFHLYAGRESFIQNGKTCDRTRYRVRVVKSVNDYS